MSGFESLFFLRHHGTATGISLGADSCGYELISSNQITVIAAGNSRVAPAAHIRSAKMKVRARVIVTAKLRDCW